MRLLHRLVTWNQHTCPWWFGYTFDNPLRRHIHDPRTILNGLVANGDVVADLGCGLGYFTLALAELVGQSGRVVAVDVQPQMLSRARRRAKRRGLEGRIEFHQCAPNALGLAGEFDFALAFWMLALNWIGLALVQPPSESRAYFYLLRLAAFTLIVFGIVALAVGGIRYTTREKVLDLGPVEATAERDKTIPLSPIVGLASIAGGVAILVVGTRTRV